MPCLNEEKTVAGCVAQALHFMKENHIDGEVLVVDNGSTDSSGSKAGNTFWSLDFIARGWNSSFAADEAAYAGKMKAEWKDGLSADKVCKRK